METTDTQQVQENPLASPPIPFRRYLQQFAMVIALAVMMTVVSSLNPNFLTASNLLNVARQVALTAILGAGATVVIISGGIDLSVGGVIALTGALVAKTLIATDGNILLAIFVGLGVGASTGVFHGLVITRLNIQPFIVTLATMTITRGMVLILTSAIPISLLAYEEFGILGQGYIGPIPIPIIIMLAVFAFTFFLLKKTQFGRYTFAIGGNETATRIAGVNVDYYKVLIYTFNGLLVGLSGIIFTSRLLAGIPTLGVGFELTAITMVILGGTSFVGGQGTIWGTLIGAMILGVLANALNLLNVSAFYHDLSTGVVILIAVVIDQLLRRERV